MPQRYFADETDLGLGKRLEKFLPGEVVYPGHPDLPEVALGCRDEMWLEVVGRRKLVVITRDARIRTRPVQKAKWIHFQVRGFVLTGRKNQSTEGSFTVLKKNWRRISEYIQENPVGPWMCSVTTGGIREMPLQ